MNETLVVAQTTNKNRYKLNRGKYGKLDTPDNSGLDGFISTVQPEVLF